LAEMQAKVEAFASIVESSPHPVIKYIWKHGMPRSCGGVLPEGVWVVCGNCRSRVNVVPCVICTPSNLKDKVVRPVTRGRPRDTPFAKAKFPTTELPGTDAKMEVMRQRVAAGQSPFHPDDPVCGAHCDNY
jgi:hypothetical protein